MRAESGVDGMEVMRRVVRSVRGHGDRCSPSCLSYTLSVSLWISTIRNVQKASAHRRQVHNEGPFEADKPEQQAHGRAKDVP